MCVVCGCGDAAGAAAGATIGSAGGAAPPEGVLVDPHTGDLHYGAGAARVSVPGMSQQRALKLEADVLGENDRIARDNRAHFAGHGIAALNFVSSPGSGKTTLLCATIEALRLRAPDLAVAVIEGDQQTSFDADRIRATGAPAIQVNTGKGCHLDARMVADAFARLPLHGDAHGHAGHAAHLHRQADGHLHAHAAVHGHVLEHDATNEHRHSHRHDHENDHGHGHSHGHGHGHGHGHDHGHPHDHAHARAHEHEHEHEHAHDHSPADAHDHPHAAGRGLLLIENVGNLVCPALWDLGEAAKVAILSVTEGEDKPLKYPDMFAASRLMVLNKIDLLPHLRFDVDRCIAFARRVNPQIEVLQVSATTGAGMDAWLDWLLAVANAQRAPAAQVTDAAEPASGSSQEAALRARIAELEAALARAEARAR